MSHANAVLTSRARLRLVRLIVDDGWTPSVAAKMSMVSTLMARKWAARMRLEGPAGMADQSRRPRSMPTGTSLPVVKQIVKARWRRRLGPVRFGEGDYVWVATHPTGASLTYVEGDVFEGVMA